MSTPRSKKSNGSQDVDPTPALGKTIQRLRKAYNMSLGELSEQSGVAKSIISQIERNETNPTLSTVFRLSRALETSIDEVLKADSGTAFLDHQLKSAIPILESQDGLCRLAIIGPLNLIELTQWYDFQAKPSGLLESDPHPPGTVEHLYLLKGEVQITVGDEVRTAKAGRPSATAPTCPTRSATSAKARPTPTWCSCLGNLVIPPNPSCIQHGSKS